jgi:hypothetical protein
MSDTTRALCAALCEPIGGVESIHLALTLNASAGDAAGICKTVQDARLLLDEIERKANEIEPGAKLKARGFQLLNGGVA